MAKKPIRTLVTAVVATAYGLTNLTGAQAVPPPNPSPDDQDRFSDVLQTINRISSDNPTAYLRVQVAQDAGQSQLTAALVQAVSRADSPEQVAQIIQDLIASMGGLTNRNVISLEELLAALRAMGISEEIISAAIAAYSVEVAEAVAARTLDPAVTAAIISQTDGSLYGAA